MDAIHIATALKAGATEFQTYDERLQKRAKVLGLVVSEPSALQQQLDLPE